jgi:hypothetical protein
MCEVAARQSKDPGVSCRITEREREREKGRRIETNMIDLDIAARTQHTPRCS